MPFADFSHRCSSSVCTQLLVSRSDEDNISCYLQLIDKCLNHEVSSTLGRTTESLGQRSSCQDRNYVSSHHPLPPQSFTETQKKRLLSWKQQVQRLFRSIPRKALLDIAGYRTQRR